MPLLRENESIGAIALRRLEVHPFSDKQIALLQTFADQAVIAIGNVRLFEEVQAKTRDLTKSLQQQTATAEVLEVISSSPGDLAPVFEKMLENATRVCGAKFGTMNLVEDDAITAGRALQCASGRIRRRSDTNVSAASEKRPWPVDREPSRPLHIAGSVGPIRAILRAHPARRLIGRSAGARTVVIVPMLRDAS